MATLDAAVTARLRATLRELGLAMRNWSGPDGDWMFAIADRGDNYQGCVALRELDGIWQLRIDRPERCARKQREVLEALCRTFALVPVTA